MNEPVKKVFLSFEKENKIPNDNEFRAEFNKEIGKEKKSENELSFFEVYDLFVKEEGKKNVWTKATYQKIETQKRYLLEFDSNISFKDFTESKLIEFQYYLQEELKLKNSTLLKRFSFLRWFLRWALRKKYISDNTFETFRPKLKTTQKKIIFLTQSELEKLKECNIPSQKQYLERVRDVFLFQCFTGLRYSDVVNLKKSNIKDDSIHITTIKTTDSLVIELNKYSKALIEKYKKLEGDKVFSVITNQKMNEYLKELGELAEINEIIRETYYRGNKRFDIETPKYTLLGTHAGRRTFICNALSLGIPPQVVMKWTGHSDYKAMKPYIDIADEIKINAMEKFNLL